MNPWLHIGEKKLDAGINNVQKDSSCDVDS